MNVERHRIDDFKFGWLVGDFEPSLFRTKEVEVSIKFLEEGTSEQMHYQTVSKEATIVVSGTCRVGAFELSAGDVLVLPPMLSADFFARSACIIVAIKWPSIPSDKVIGEVEN